MALTTESPPSPPTTKAATTDPMKVEELENKRIRIAKTIKNTPNTKPTTRSAFDLIMGLSVDFVIKLTYELIAIALLGRNVNFCPDLLNLLLILIPFTQ
jgi:hypothetical protein